jgi:hypothetical protein
LFLKKTLFRLGTFLFGLCFRKYFYRTPELSGTFIDVGGSPLTTLEEGEALGCLV